MEQNTKQLIELLMQGVQDEMNSAYNYIALAGRYGGADLKQAFLNYASEELKHAQKLMKMLHCCGRRICGSRRKCFPDEICPACDDSRSEG